jgi:hypothetical protein
VDCLENIDGAECMIEDAKFVIRKPFHSSISALSGREDFMTKIDVPKIKSVGRLFPFVLLIISCLGTELLLACICNDCSADTQ